MNKIEPIKPEEVVQVKLATIPDKIIKAFNEMIGENWNGSSSRFLLKDVRKRIGGVIKDEWLDVEPIYRSQGWVVKYDSPVYDETFDAFFVFSKHK